MKKPVMKRKFIVAVMFLLFTSFALAELNVLEPTQNPNAPYRLFNTQNIFTFLKLDTRSGKIWQLQWGMKLSSQFIVPINIEALSPNKVPGRFTLYPTSNTYIFILLDQRTGDSWQVQWSMEEENRFILPIIELGL